MMCLKCCHIVTLEDEHQKFGSQSIIRIYNLKKTFYLSLVCEYSHSHSQKCYKPQFVTIFEMSAEM